MIPQLAAWVRQARLARGMSQGDLAEKSGVSRELINRLENQRVPYISELTMIRLVKALKKRPPARLLDPLTVMAGDEEYAPHREIDWDEVLHDPADPANDEPSPETTLPAKQANLEDRSALPHNIEPIDDPKTRIVNTAGLGKPDTFVVRVLGDSRSGDFNPGDLIVISRTSAQADQMLALIEIDMAEAEPWRVLGYIHSCDGGYEIQPLCSTSRLLVPSEQVGHAYPAIGHISIRPIAPPRGTKTLRLVTHALPTNRPKRRGKRSRKEP